MDESDERALERAECVDDSDRDVRVSDIRELRSEADPDEEESAEETAPLGPTKVHPEEIDEARLIDVLESLLFVADQPVSAVRLAKLARTRVANVRKVLTGLIASYEDRGIQLIEVAGGYQFRSAPRNAEFVRNLVAHRPVRLTRAQLETLSIVAYRQPVTRPEIDEIRGVDSGSALKVLLERNLLKLLGRKEEPGRPLLYGTTPQFLEFFGLAGLRDLPTLREFSELNEESRALFERRMGEPLDLADPGDAGESAAHTSAETDATDVSASEPEDDWNEDDGITAERSGEEE